jgi:ankyrin repeat protein
MKDVLKNLPTGPKAYDYTYEEAMKRIAGHDADSEELAKQVLLWITCSKRPLSTSELQYALAVEVGKAELDEENLPQLEDMVSVCAGLVTVDEESGIIRLVHYTTQEYFERTQRQWFPNAEVNITTICVTYLLFDEFESGICQNDKEFEERLRLYPLYKYAAQNWGHHARAASTKAVQLTLNLLEDEHKALASTQAMVAPGPFPGYSQQRVPKQMTGVHRAALFELNEAILALLRNGHYPDSKDSSGQTPLSWAAENGHEAVVRLLLEKGAELESKDNNNQTPLLWAIRNGHETAVRLLLEKGAKLKSKDKMLLLAARRGHEAVVGLLLEKGAKLESKDNNSRTPLSWAARNGREAVVKLLLATEKVDVDSKDSEYGQTPLSWAAENGHEAVVRLLLAIEKVDADSKDTKYGQTSLSYAAENGHEAVVKLLLATGQVNVDSKDNSGRTPLSYAASRGHEAVVKVLLEKGADVESKGKHSQTPLLHATSSGHEGIVRMLREYIS